MSKYLLSAWQDYSWPEKAADLVILDPIYDKIDETIVAIDASAKWLKKGGSLYVFGDSSSVASIKIYLDEVRGWHFQNWLIWGPNDWGGRSSRRFGQKHDDILFYTRNGADHYFDGAAVSVKKKMTQETFNPSGRMFKIPHSVWHDLGGFSTVSLERVKVNGHAVRWQKPQSVIKRIVLASCPQGGMVYDPFAGVATVSAVCKYWNRQCIATENDPEVYEAGLKRLGS